MKSSTGAIDVTHNNQLGKGWAPEPKLDELAVLADALLKDMLKEIFLTIKEKRNESSKKESR